MAEGTCRRCWRGGCWGVDRAIGERRRATHGRSGCVRNDRTRPSPAIQRGAPRRRPKAAFRIWRMWDRRQPRLDGLVRCSVRVLLEPAIAATSCSVSVVARICACPCISPRRDCGSHAKGAPSLVLFLFRAPIRKPSARLRRCERRRLRRRVVEPAGASSPLRRRFPRLVPRSAASPCPSVSPRGRPLPRRNSVQR